MRLQRLAKDKDSGYGGCETIYDDLDSDYCVIQGLDDVPMALLENVLPGEGAVRIKRSILIEAADRYQRGAVA